MGSSDRANMQKSSKSSVFNGQLTRDVSLKGSGTYQKSLLIVVRMAIYILNVNRICLFRESRIEMDDKNGLMSS